MPEGLAISDLILHASSEIRRARDQMKDRGDPVIELSDCELELACTFKNEGKAGIRIWVIEAGANVSGETVSRIKMKFGPVQGANLQFVSKEGGDAGPPNPGKMP